jgi:alpha-N-arabinofuranosidase
MTAMERNSDLIVMHCYAPLLTNINRGASQWRPDLIGYDALQAFGSPSYYAFKMFSQNHGDEVVLATLTGQPEGGKVDALYYSVTKDSKNGKIYLKIVNTTATPQTVQIVLKGAMHVSPEGTLLTLSSANLGDTNSIQEPAKVVPTSTKVNGLGSDFAQTLAPYSVNILQFEIQQSAE